MIDTPTNHAGDNSREYIAYLLFIHVVNAEGKTFEKGTDGAPKRKWILDTYAECLTTVGNPESRKEIKPIGNYR